MWATKSLLPPLVATALVALLPLICVSISACCIQCAKRILRLASLRILQAVHISKLLVKITKTCDRGDE